MIVLGQGASQAPVVNTLLSQEEVLSRLGDSSFVADSAGLAGFLQLLRLCRRNSETACLIALWGRARTEVKREFMKKPFLFLKEKVLPYLGYQTTLRALYVAILRAMSLD